MTDYDLAEIASRLVSRVGEGEQVEVVWFTVFAGSALPRETVVGWVRHDFPMTQMWSPEEDKWIPAPAGTVASWWGLLCDCDDRETSRHGGCVAQSAADTLRQAELVSLLGEEFPAKKHEGRTEPWKYDVGAAADAAEWLCAQSEDNVYVGNRTGNLLYLQQVATALEWSSPEFWWKVVDELERRKSITLNGMILIPWYDREPLYVEREKRTGHRRFESGDFGDWSCFACGANGDSQDSPNDVVCDPAKVKSGGQ